jgi:DNA-binding NarL/FixJ family response regulator
LLRIRIGRKRPPGASPLTALSDREMEVFAMIARGEPTRRIAENLRRSVKTIESHRENIKKKLRLGSNYELMRRAVEWVLREG